jgi:glycosyltransferase involved in cell wall biosynthesis
MDGAVIAAGAVGALLANVSGDVRRPPGPSGPRRSVVVFVDLFPERSETFVVAEANALAEGGHRVRVEAGVRARRPSWGAARGLATWYWEDEGILRKIADTAWLVARHPGGCLRDLLARRRWEREERVWPLRSLASPARRIVQHGDEHLHAHFASSAALSAQRLATLLGRTFSVTAHAYDIFQTPRNLDEKLRAANFVTTGCDYNVEYLRARPGAAGARIERVIMGVDPEAFRRATPYPGGSHVVAVGRLVPKKGYDLLIDAVALIAPADRPRVTIVGDGSERAALAAQISERGVEDAVTLAGPMEPAAIRALLERAAVLAMPCVVAPDGDRDSMPVVVKEAMAMEIPVIASDEVGNPEMVGPDRGVLVAPGDAATLEHGLRRLLDLPDAERAAMGVAGRRWVLEHADVRRETARLSALIEGL